MYATSLLVWYTLKYNHHNWERMWGVYIRTSRTATLPGDPAYPADPRPNPEDYYDYGFKTRTVFRDL